MVAKCPNCGADNPDGYTNCSSCRAELGRPAAHTSAGDRRCVACGRELAWDANVCPYCGRDYRIRLPSVREEEPVSSGMKIVLYLVSFFVPLAGFIIGAIYYVKPGQEYKKVGKVCIILAIVSVVISFAAAVILYLAVLNFGGYHDVTDWTPTSSLTMTLTDSGYRFSFAAMDPETFWSDIAIILSDGDDSVDWSPSTFDLVGQGSEGSALGSESLGWAVVWCNVTDLAGNGLIDAGDSFTLETSSDQGFAGGTTYIVTVMHEPTGGEICGRTFTA